MQWNKTLVMACAVACILGLATLAARPGQASDDTGPAGPDTVAAEGIFGSFEEVGEDELLSLLDGGEIHAGVSGAEFYVETGDGGRYVCRDWSSDLLPYMRFRGVEPVALPLATDARQSGPGDPFLETMLTACALLAGGLCVIVLFRRRTARNPDVITISAPAPQSGSDSRQPARPARDPNVPEVRFADVEGVEELKDDIMRLVDCLKNPDRYRALGARTPKGVILYGPPGTGKTLLAKAVAGEAGVPFLAVCGSDFVEKYVGVGAQRVRELYAKARKQAPCIVFIDEVDAIAAKRGDGDNSERDQAVNALLAELDGFKSSAGIITICATNRLELLDSAFKRAGRFDLKLAVGLPDLEARENILRIYARNKPMGDGIDLRQLAKKCVGFSGADLEAMLNEAAMAAAGRESDFVDACDVDAAFFKIVMQGNRKPLRDRDETLRIIAWHEAGHALAIKLLTGDSVPSVTIVGSSSGAGGVTFRAPDEKVLKSRKYLRDTICTLYAGRAAEEILLGDADLVTTGAQQDIKQATGLIRDYLASYGMGEKGMLDLSQFRRDLAGSVDEASDMAQACYGKVLQVLTDRRESLAALAGALLDRETLDEAEIDAIVGAGRTDAA